MSVESLNKCKLTYPVVKHDETNIELNYDHFDSAKWCTETEDSFVAPNVEEQKIGKRRELLMKYFRIRAAKKALDDIIGDPPLPEAACFTEYIDNFCNNDFTPLMEHSEFDIQKLMKDPLYAGDVQTYYKEQFDKGNLKADTEFRNQKRPFVKSSLFTTPPELALDEPINGF